MMKVRELTALQSWGWYVAAWRQFLRAPFVWLFLTGSYLGFVLLCVVLPFIGAILYPLVQELFGAGLIACAHTQHTTGKLEPPKMYEGFRRNTKSIVIYAALLAAVQMVLGLTVFTIAPPSFDVKALSVTEQLREAAEVAAAQNAASSNTSTSSPALSRTQSSTQSEPSDEAKTKAARAALEQAVRDYVLNWWWLWLATIALVVVLRGLVWFCSALLIQHDMPWHHALRWSAYAVLSNAGAMLIYALIFFMILVGLTLLAAVPLLSLLSLVGALALIPMMFLTQYHGYRAVFDLESTADQAPTNSAIGQA